MPMDEESISFSISRWHGLHLTLSPCLDLLLCTILSFNFTLVQSVQQLIWSKNGSSHCITSWSCQYEENVYIHSSILFFLIFVNR